MRAPQLYKANINGGPILRFTMATGDKKRFAYFTPLELEILVHPYSEFEHVFRIESNSATVAKERE